MAQKIFDKDPNEVLDYKVDWDDDDWLNGDTISTSTWIVQSGITKDSDSFTTAVATIWLSGGEAGKSYDITNRITTAASPSRTANRTIEINVVNR